MFPLCIIYTMLIMWIDIAAEKFLNVYKKSNT